ncbi:LuxR C-terminal-related transcriptional regulator [Methylobacterium variabile]|jgi:PAS domain S-box-containing protein|uniref:LuxR C-terminal-related transcriptional regulator n=1 Tax=Methylobacterium variabile TaxID=298794 RepID=UPI0009FA15AE|nr:PAS domain S-box protein [Methylobacterium variabile]
MAAFRSPTLLSLDDIPVPAVVGSFRVMKDCNSAYCSLYGYNKDELIGKSFGILYVEHHDYVSKWKNFTKSVSDDDIYLDERIMRRRDGSRFWCRVSGRRISSDPSSTDSLFCVESLRRPVDWEGRSLSGRQREICSLLVRGFSSQKIGEELGLSVRTIEDHRSRLLRQANVQNTAELIAWFCDERR